MSTDLALVIGIVVAVLTVPAIFSAVIDGAAPRVAAFAAVVSGALIVYAVYTKPGGYAINELPEIFSRVIAQLIR